MTEWKNRIVGTALVDPAALVPNAKNYRRHPKAQIGALEGSLREVGWVAPVTVNRTSGRMVDGHARAELALREGVALVPVQYVELSDAEEALVLATLDPIGAMAAHDAEALAALLGEVRTGEAALLTLLAQIAKDAGIVGVDAGRDTPPEIDRAEELRKKWGVAPGQLWRLGDHRLICGDCTDAGVVGRVMADDQLRCVWTDPPYGVSYADKNEFLNALDRGNSNQTPIEHDHMSEADTEKLVADALCRAVGHAEKGASVYVACPPGTLLPHFIAAVAASGFTYKHSLVWVKNQFVLSRCDYHYRHELILYGWIENGAHYFAEDHTQHSVFEIDKPRSSAEHPTMKPIELPAGMIANSTRPGEVVYDPFCGSGTTLIACENLGRRCRAVEIAPGYVAVALERWATHTGGTPELLGA